MKKTSLTPKKMEEALGSYLAFCNSDAKKPRFPNLAGFCRFLKIGRKALSKWENEHPESADYILTVLEDELWNSPLSASLISSYFKERMKEKESDNAISVAFEGGMDAD